MDVSSRFRHLHVVLALPRFATGALTVVGEIQMTLKQFRPCRRRAAESDATSATCCINGLVVTFLLKGQLIQRAEVH